SRHMAVIEPSLGTWFTGEGAGAFVEMPHVSEARPRSHRRALSRPGAIIRALAVLVVMHSVRMHREWLGGAIEEGDDQVIADYSAQDRAQEAEGGVRQGTRRERFVGVEAIA